MANRMVVSIVGDNRQLKQTLADTEKRLNKQTANIQRMGQTMSRVGSNMTKYITLPLVGLGVAATKSGADFQDAMTKSLAIMSDVTPELRKQMEDTARDVVNYTEFSATQAAEAYFFLASAGLDAAQSIEALPKVAKFAQAGNFDLALATDLLTDSQSALGLTIRDDVTKNMENMVKVSDVLVRANTLSNATVSQFAESLTNRAGAALRLVNKDLEEGVAVLAAWADQGVKGAEAGTRMDIVLRDLQNASLRNKEAFEEMGISVFDADGNLRNLADIIANMEIAFDNMSDAELRTALTTLGFTDRSIAATASLLGASDAIKEYEKQLREAAGFTEDVAAKQMESFTAQMKQLKNMAVDAGIDIFEVLLPTLEDLFGSIKDGVKWFSDLSVEQKKMIVNLAAVTAVAGPALLIFGKLTTGVIALQTNMALLNVTMGATAGGAAAMTGLIGAGAIQLTGRAYQIYEAIQKIKEGTADWKTYVFDLGTLLGGFDYPIRKLIGAIQKYNGETDKTIEFKDRHTQALDRLDEGYNRYVDSIGEADVTEKINKATVESLMQAYDLTEDEAREFAEANGLIKDSTDDSTESIDDQTDSLEELRKEFNKVIDDIFGHITTYNDFEEALWAVEDAEKAVEEAIAKYGEGSREAEEKVNGLNDAHITAIETAFELSVATNATKEQQEEARQKALELGRQYVESGEVGIESFIALAEQFGLSAEYIYGVADTLEERLNDVTRPRTIPITVKVSGTEIDVDVTPYMDPGVLGGSVTTQTGGTPEPINPWALYKKEGGIIPQADSGLMLPSFDTDGVLAMLHPPEVVLNPKQALNVVWNAAQGKLGGSSQSIENNFNIDHIVIREEADIHKVATELYSMQKTNMAGSGIK